MRSRNGMSDPDSTTLDLPSFAVPFVRCALMNFKIPGTKRVDHKRAVKIYERAAGDKTLPSDLRPPPVLKVRTWPSKCYKFIYITHPIVSENARLPLPRSTHERRLHTNLHLHS